MTTELIENPELISKFKSFLGETTHKSAYSKFQPTMSGPNLNLSETIELKLPEIFRPSDLSGNPKYLSLYNGDLSAYEGDHSSADLALCSHLARKGLSISEADELFRSSKLYRPKWDELRGKLTYGQLTLEKAFAGVMWTQSGDHASSKLKADYHYEPVYVSDGMPPREHAGPEVAPGVALFPTPGLSAIAGLGAVGKTSLMMQLAVHIAAGKSWNNSRVKQRKVVIVSIEETQDELNRKFSAAVDGLDTEAIEACKKNLRLISVLGQDARLTRINGRQISGSDWVDEIIDFCKNFGLYNGVVFLDHTQGFVAGDLNLSETATAICREANRIAFDTQSAVVLLAHIAKNNTKATEADDGFVVGSLAFENAMRQVVGLTSMQEEEVKKYVLDGERQDYTRLFISKNSYGPSRVGAWLKKIRVPKYHTVKIEPVDLQTSQSRQKISGEDGLINRLVQFVSESRYATKNILDNKSGKDGLFKASKERVRSALNAAIDLGLIEWHELSTQEAKDLGTPKQAKRILRAARTKKNV